MKVSKEIRKQNRGLRSSVWRVWRLSAKERTFVVTDGFEYKSSDGRTIKFLPGNLVTIPRFTRNKHLYFNVNKVLMFAGQINE